MFHRNVVRNLAAGALLANNGLSTKTAAEQVAAEALKRAEGRDPAGAAHAAGSAGELARPSTKS